MIPKPRQTMSVEKKIGKTARKNCFGEKTMYAQECFDP